MDYSFTRESLNALIIFLRFFLLPLLPLFLLRETARSGWQLHAEERGRCEL